MSTKKSEIDQENETPKGPTPVYQKNETPKGSTLVFFPMFLTASVILAVETSKQSIAFNNPTIDLPKYISLVVIHGFLIIFACLAALLVIDFINQNSQNFAPWLETTRPVYLSLLIVLVAFFCINLIFEYDGATFLTVIFSILLFRYDIETIILLLMKVLRWVLILFLINVLMTAIMWLNTTVLHLDLNPDLFDMTLARVSAGQMDLRQYENKLRKVEPTEPINTDSFLGRLVWFTMFKNLEAPELEISPEGIFAKMTSFVYSSFVGMAQSGSIIAAIQVFLSPIIAKAFGLDEEGISNTTVQAVSLTLASILYYEFRGVIWRVFNPLMANRKFASLSVLYDITGVNMAQNLYEAMTQQIEPLSQSFILMKSENDSREATEYLREIGICSPNDLINVVRFLTDGPTSENRFSDQQTRLFKKFNELSDKEKALVHRERYEFINVLKNIPNSVDKNELKKLKSVLEDDSKLPILQDIAKGLMNSENMKNHHKVYEYLFRGFSFENAEKYDAIVKSLSDKNTLRIFHRQFLFGLDKEEALNQELVDESFIRLKFLSQELFISPCVLRFTKQSQLHGIVSENKHCCASSDNPKLLYNEKKIGRCSTQLNIETKKYQFVLQSK